EAHPEPLCQLCPDLRTFIHSALSLRTGLGAGPPDACFSERKRGDDVRFLKRSGSSFKLPTLRFRAKIMLGFAVVLAISAASMGFAYLGFERVSDVVDSYRRSVQEADLSRDIDRELISYRALARYFVVTGKEEDGKAALEREFRTFTKIFADMLKTKDESGRIARDQLARTGNSLRYKLDDLPSNAEDEEMPLITLGAKKVTEQFQATTALANTFVVNADQSVATSAQARLKFVENALKAISTKNEKILDGINEVSGMLEEYRKSLAMLIGNAKEIEGLTQEMTETAAEINKASAAMKADMLAEQK